MESSLSILSCLKVLVLVQLPPPLWKESETGHFIKDKFFPEWGRRCVWHNKFAQAELRKQ